LAKIIWQKINFIFIEMMVITEVAITWFIGLFLCFYASDTLYWIYENEIEKKQKETEKEEDEKAEEIRKQIADTLYS
jgi:hypothetical protein